MPKKKVKKKEKTRYNVCEQDVSLDLAFNGEDELSAMDKGSPKIIIGYNWDGDSADFIAAINMERGELVSKQDSSVWLGQRHRLDADCGGKSYEHWTYPAVMRFINKVWANKCIDYIIENDFRMPVDFDGPRTAGKLCRYSNKRKKGFFLARIINESLFAKTSDKGWEYKEK